MYQLQVSLFGRVHVEHVQPDSACPDRAAAEVTLTRTIQGLLAYLLIHRRRTHSRDVLGEVFWGEHTNEHARGCLNTALWRLRRAIEPDGVSRGAYLITTSDGEIGFNSHSPFWLDVAVFEANMDRLEARPCEVFQAGEITEIESAIDLYTSDLMEGFHDDWALRERERLRSRLLSGLAKLMLLACSRGDFARSLDYGRRILELDPLREEVHRDMMRAYALSGQRTLMARQYECCQHVLRRELDIDPMPETQALYSALLSRPEIALERRPDAASQPSERPGAAASQSTPDAAAFGDLVRQALQALQDAQAQMQRAIALVEQSLSRVDQQPQG